MTSGSLFDLFNKERVQRRSYDELVGLCKGIIADGKINQSEAEFLLNWLHSHEGVADLFPANILAPRLAEMLQDSVLEQEEAEELLSLLRELTGEQGQQARGAAPTAMGFDDPMPALTISGQSFCLTGTFQSGQRKEIEKQLAALDASVSGNVTKSRPCCLVVGSLVTESWKYSTHGRKLESAVAYREEGCPVQVISEDHLWSEIDRLGLLAHI